MTTSAIDPSTEYCHLHTHTLAISTLKSTNKMISWGIMIKNKKNESLPDGYRLVAIQLELEIEKASASGRLEGQW